MAVLTPEQAQQRANDKSHGMAGPEIKPITEVTESESGYDVMQDGIGFFLDKKYGVKPKVGDLVRLYTVNFSQVRGMDLNGEPIFYKTDAELEEDRKRWIAEDQRQRQKKWDTSGRTQFEKDYASLPWLFKHRIDRFVAAGGEDWKIKFGDYEMICCTQGAKMAELFKTKDELKAFADAPWEKQREMMPDLDGGHSGNTFGMAVRLAYWAITKPENVILEHGALAMLVGCDDYSCTHPAKSA